MFAGMIEDPPVGVSYRRQLIVFVGVNRGIQDITQSCAIPSIVFRAVHMSSSDSDSVSPEDRDSIRIRGSRVRVHRASHNDTQGKRRTGS